MTYTVDDIMAKEPCYTRDQIAELWAGRVALAAKEILALPISDSDKRWVVVQLRITAAITTTGTVFWYRRGKLHRMNGPAIEFADGSETWLLNDMHHRVDGPAMVFNGAKYWYLNGLHHRVDGPAIEYAGGGGRWFINGTEYTESDYHKALEAL